MPVNTVHCTLLPEAPMSDFGTLKRKYQQLRELQESKAHKEPARKVTAPPKRKPVAPPRVRPVAPIPAAELGQGSKLQLRHELAKAGIGLGADDPDDPNLLGAHFAPSDAAMPRIARSC